MDDLRVLKTAEDYEAALSELRRLLDGGAIPGSPLGDRLEVLTVLLGDYEQTAARTLDAPSPVDAILFRMEQQDLGPRDLVPYLGSASRVSEILSGKRRLSLTMIRALHDGLGIPLGSLVSEAPDSAPIPQFEWARLPLSEMASRHWITDPTPEAAARLIQPMLKDTPQAFFRRLLHQRSNRTADEYSVLAWTAQVFDRCVSGPTTKRPTASEVRTLISDVVRLSWSNDGPKLAVELLRAHGVCVVLEPPLARTYLDGVAIVSGDRAAIGLTVRFDRLDSFWFTLIHELAHLSRHASRDGIIFVDDLESGPDDDIEREADATARDALIPEKSWLKSPASRLRSPQAVEHLANELRIHPAIVAGRVRRQYNSYNVLSELVGTGQVRKHFPEVSWAE